MADKYSLRIKKSVMRQRMLSPSAADYVIHVRTIFLCASDAIAKVIVYSMSVDGPVRQDAAPTPRSEAGRFEAQQTGFLVGSRALDSLDRLITSTESFFHPSNSGPWTVNVSYWVLMLWYHLMLMNFD